MKLKDFIKSLTEYAVTNPDIMEWEIVDSFTDLPLAWTIWGGTPYDGKIRIVEDNIEQEDEQEDEQE